MKIEQLADVERIPLAIDYRRMYRADVHISIAERATPPAPIEFSLELSPFGGHEVSVRFLGQTEYPILPAIKLLKAHIQTMDKAGQLP